MMDLYTTGSRFNSCGVWSKAIDKILYEPIPADLALFDQNGYDLTPLEQQYAHANMAPIAAHRYHLALKYDWMSQPEKTEGAVLNHCNLFERKGYANAAREQLTEWSKHMPLVNKLLSLRPKWGLDFSMDYVDRQGNVFEILHWEYDGFEYGEIEEQRERWQPTLLHMDWDDAGQRLLKHKAEWHHLGFFEQSAWKCKYFGIIDERFKMVAWE